MKLRHTPPAWADRFLEWFCADDQLEILQGDLHELYQDRLERLPRWRVNLCYFRDVLDMLRPFALKRKRTLYTLNQVDMFKNYWKIGWRNLLKERLFGFINIISLALAITVVSFIFLYLKQEMSYDKFHTQGERIYRMARFQFESDRSITERDVYLPEPLANAMTSSYPQVEQTVRIFNTEVLVNHNNNFFDQQALFTDPSFTDMFSFELLEGNKNNILQDPNSVVITPKMAEKYFKHGDAVGKTLNIRLNNEPYSFNVSGIIANAPVNSSVQYDMLVPLSFVLTNFEFAKRSVNNWGMSYLQTFVLLQPGADIAHLNDQMDQLWMKNNQTSLDFMQERGTWKEGSPAPFTYHLQPLHEMHSDINFPGGITAPVDGRKYYILGGIALFVLLLGCINFTLLSMGKSGRRAKEIGMRKTLGARRSQVVLQFWSESCITSLVALVAAIGMVYLALPVFNEMAQAALTFQDFIRWDSLAIMLGVTLFTGLLAGVYPSLVLSSFEAITAMKSRVKMGGNSMFSRSLIVVQFAVSAFFIIGALVIDHQVSYMKNKDIGIDKEGVMVLSVADLDDQESEVYRKTISNYSFVENASGIRFRLPVYSNAGWSYNGEGYKGYILAVDRNFPETFGLELVAGRNFLPEESDSVNALVVNEALVARMGWENPIGQRLLGYERKGLNEPVIIGVVKNFHFQSLENEIEPMIITINPAEPLSNLMVRMNTSNLGENLEVMSSEWKTLFPDKPFQYSFLEDDLEAEYASQERWSTILRVASIMNVFIACLGLFGFATLYMTGRLKEIGVRKVFGGSTASIFYKIASQFLVLVLAGFTIAGYFGRTMPVISVKR
ncbi:ABC transporter permease, partial [Fulvivirga imtechensis]|uniref:ABC transporter permease n=1 Tax=Fulvivirga imtechensis TaxID=881893 RepID=UPI00058CE527